MKILFIKPPQNRSVISTTRYEPLEFEYLAAAVPDCERDIFDMRIEKNLEKKLDSFKPDIVGITAYTCDVKTVKSILKEVKIFREGIKTVLGGIHATFIPQDFHNCSVDAVFLGYADFNFPRYVDALDSGADVREIENLGLKNGDGFFFTAQKPVKPDLDSLPLPDRGLTEKYRNKYHDSLRNKLALVMTSRGCPFRCTFCACWKLMSGKYVNRDVDSIVAELKSLPEDVRTVYFSDDNTVHDTKRAWKLAEKIKENKINKKLQMYARADTIVKHPDLFRNLREAGLEHVTVGFESFSDEGLKKLNKKTTVAMNGEAIRVLKKLGVFINAHFIINPEFTKTDFDDLLRYVDRNHLFRPAYPVLTPLPGTELFDETRGTLAIRDYDFYDFAHSVLPTKLDRKEFYRQLAQLYNRSYSLGRFVRYMFMRRKPGGVRNTDGISLLKLLVIRVFAIFMYFKMKNAYKSESTAA
jgi:radical SAM superfamily enzyme YgiQ (UPF0313 family)